MSNFVFYDFETSSSNKYWGQIIQIGAILTNDNLEELEKCHCFMCIETVTCLGYNKIMLIKLIKNYIRMEKQSLIV